MASPPCSVLIEILLLSTVPLPVFLDNPWGNGVVNIHSFKDSKHDGYLVDGYTLVVKGWEVTKMLEEHVQAYMIDNKRVAVVKPTLDPLDMNEENSGRFLEALVEQGLACERMKEQYLVDLYALLEDESKQTLVYVLTFPDGYELTNETFAPNAVDGRLPTGVVALPIKEKAPTGPDSTRQQWANAAGFRIALAEPTKRRVVKPANAMRTSLKDKFLAQQMASMSIDSQGNSS
jgi:hypothetical protein